MQRKKKRKQKDVDVSFPPSLFKRYCSWYLWRISYFIFIADACVWKEVFHRHLRKPWFFQYLMSRSEEGCNSVSCGTLRSSLLVCFQWIRRFKSKPFRMCKVKWSPSKLYETVWTWYTNVCRWGRIVFPFHLRARLCRLSCRFSTRGRYVSVHFCFKLHSGFTAGEVLYYFLR